MILVFENLEVLEIVASQLLYIRYSIFTLTEAGRFIKSEGIGKGGTLENKRILLYRLQRNNLPKVLGKLGDK